MVNTWAKNFVKCGRQDVEPVHIFLLGNGGTGKSNLVKVIYNAISKTLLYHCKDPEKLKVLLLGPTGISAVNIAGTSIHSGLAIKLGTKLLGLNDKSKADLRNRLSDVELLIIDKLSMVSSDLWADIDSRLGEAFMMIPEKTFAGLSVMAVAALLQLPPVRAKPMFSQFSDKDSIKHLLSLQLWHLLHKYAELTEVVRQIINFLLTCSLKFELATLMMM